VETQADVTRTRPEPQLTMIIQPDDPCTLLAADEDVRSQCGRELCALAIVNVKGPTVALLCGGYPVRPTGGSGFV
jgi:hypothetical protein